MPIADGLTTVDSRVTGRLFYLYYGHELADEEMQRLQQRIAPCVREIHAYWLRRRGQHLAGEPVRRGAPKIGRNDPPLVR